MSASPNTVIARSEVFLNKKMEDSQKNLAEIAVKIAKMKNTISKLYPVEDNGGQI